MFNRHSANCFKSKLQFKLQVARTLTIRGNMRLFNGQRENEICVYDGYEFTGLWWWTIRLAFIKLLPFTLSIREQLVFQCSASNTVEKG